MKSEIVDMQGNKHIIDFDNLQSCFINCDCMEALRKMPDNCVDLAICDPPYGDAMQCDRVGVQQVRREVQSVCRTGGTWASKYGKKK